MAAASNGLNCLYRIMKPSTVSFSETALWQAVLATVLLAFGSNVGAAETLRAGMIGLDTSHVPAFAKLFNNPKSTGDIAGIRITVGYPGGTDLPASRDRVKG